MAEFDIHPHAVVQIVDLENREAKDSRIRFTLKIIQGTVELRTAYYLYGPKQIRVVLKPQFVAVIDGKCITDNLANIKLGLPGQKIEDGNWTAGEQHDLELHARKELLDLKVGDHLALWGLE